MGTLANYTYDAVGNISQVTRANGIKSTFGYDDLHRLTAIQHKKGTEVLSQFNYALSADGKRNTLQEYLKYPAGQPISEINRTVFYGYDNAGRLTAEQRQSTATLTAGGTQKNTARTIWTYDKVGNRLTQAVSSYDGLGVPGDPGATGVLKSTFNTSYTYNINDWLTSTTSVRNDDTGESTFVSNFEYNANGSQTAVTSNVGKPDETRFPYFYDFEHKLTSIGNPTDTTKHAYWYDADGNRIAESNTNTSGTSTRNYLVDPNNSNAQILEEYDNTNTLLAHYDWNDAELLREANWNNSTNAYDIHEPLADGHNSTRQLLDSTGSVSDLYSFDAWGNPQENVGSSVNPYRYNSQRLDASGLYYLRARQYASGIGRFLTHDPLMGNTNDPITQHRYLYAGDDAVNNIDPSGNELMAEVQFSSVIQATLESLQNPFFQTAYTGFANVVMNVPIVSSVFNSIAQSGGIAPDGVMVSFGKSVASISAFDLNFSGGIYVPTKEPIDADSVYLVSTEEVALTPRPWGTGTTLFGGGGISKGASNSVGLVYNTHNDVKSALSNMAYNATFPLGIARYFFAEANPSIESLFYIAAQLGRPGGGSIIFSAAATDNFQLDPNGASSINWANSTGLASSVSYSQVKGLSELPEFTKSMFLRTARQVGTIANESR